MIKIQALFNAIALIVIALFSLLSIISFKIFVDNNHDDGAVVPEYSSEYSPSELEQMKTQALAGDVNMAKEVFWSLYYYDENIPYEDILYWAGLASQLGDNDIAKKLSCKEYVLKHCKKFQLLTRQNKR